MATLSITVPDAQVPRVLAAFGHSTATNATWVPATQQEVRDWLLAQVKARVLDYENRLATDADRATRGVDITNW